MNNRDQELTDAVMRRVRFIYLLRSLYSPLALQTTILLSIGIGFTFSISIVDIARNISSLPRWTNSVSYLFSSVLHTELLNQLMLGASLVIVTLLAREVMRNRLLYS